MEVCMIFDELISDVTDSICDSIGYLKDATSDIREEVNDTHDAMVDSLKSIIRELKK